MGTDIMKVTYSSSWRPSQEFLEFVTERLARPDTTLWYVPDYEEGMNELRDVVPESLREELEELFRRCGGHDIVVG